MSLRQLRILLAIVLAFGGSFLVWKWLGPFKGWGPFHGWLGIALLGFLPIALPDDLYVNMFLLRVFGWMLVGTACAMLWLMMQLSQI